MQSIEPCHPDQREGVRLWGKLRRPRLTKNQTEIRPGGGEVLRAPEGDIHLQCVFQKEDAEQRRAAHDIDMSNCTVVAVERLGPFGYDSLVGSIRPEAEG